MWRHYRGGSSMYGHGCDAVSQSAHNWERGGKEAHNRSSLQAGSVWVLSSPNTADARTGSGEKCHSGEKRKSRVRDATGQWWCQWLSLTLGWVWGGDLGPRRTTRSSTAPSVNWDSRWTSTWTWLRMKSTSCFRKVPARVSRFYAVHQLVWVLGFFFLFLFFEK